MTGKGRVRVTSYVTCRDTTGRAPTAMHRYALPVIARRVSDEAISLSGEGEGRGKVTS